LVKKEKVYEKTESSEVNLELTHIEKSVSLSTSNQSIKNDKKEVKPMKIQKSPEEGGNSIVVKVDVPLDSSVQEINNDITLTEAEKGELEHTPKEVRRFFSN